MPSTLCKIESITPLTDTISQVILTPTTAVSFKPGQYLTIVMDAKDKRPFSIANAPDKDGRLELHIGAGPDNQYANEVLAKMQNEGEIQAECGLGKAYLRAQQGKPIILIAGGTGFSYTNSILQALVRQKYQEPVFLYWGTRTLDDMYCYQDLVALDNQNKQFTFVPVLDQPHEQWKGKAGWVHKAVLEDFAELESYQVYLAGRVEMASAAREDLRNNGLRLKNLFGDAYEFI